MYLSNIRSQDFHGIGGVPALSRKFGGGLSQLAMLAVKMVAQQSRKTFEIERAVTNKQQLRFSGEPEIRQKQTSSRR